MKKKFIFHICALDPPPLEKFSAPVEVDCRVTVTLHNIHYMFIKHEYRV